MLSPEAPPEFMVKAMPAVHFAQGPCRNQRMWNALGVKNACSVVLLAGPQKCFDSCGSLTVHKIKECVCVCRLLIYWTTYQ